MAGGSRLILVRIKSGMVKASGQDLYPHRAGRGDLGVAAGLDLADQLFLQVGEFEIHAAFARLHAAAGHLGAVISPDHAAEDVHGGVRAHEGVAPLPINRAVQIVAGRGQPFALDPVPHGLAFPGRFGHAPAAEPAGVVRLAAAAGVEGGAIQRHAAPFGVHVGHAGVKCLNIRIHLIQKHGHFRSIRYWVLGVGYWVFGIRYLVLIFI